METFYLLLDCERSAFGDSPSVKPKWSRQSFGLLSTVVTLNVAVVLPANTVTVEGTAALLGLLLDKATTKPPAGAGAVSVTVPTEPLPPRTLVGLRDTAESTAAAG
jgi:hypothetical protein